MGPVANLLAMDRTTLTAALKPLEKRGLLVTMSDDRDRRLRRMKLTPAGHALLSTAVPIWKRTHADVDDALGEGRPDRLRSDLLALA